VPPERHILSGQPISELLKATLAAKPGAVCAPLPSAPGVLIYKVMGKMFAILESRRVEAVILKCDPNIAEILRQQYAGVSHRSHLDRRYWICVNLDADVPPEEALRLATHSYELVRAKLTRKQRAELEAPSS
jgi:predicted DNA-binding protein (MmcQ/YjbR family)